MVSKKKIGVQMNQQILQKLDNAIADVQASLSNLREVIRGAQCDLIYTEVQASSEPKSTLSDYPLILGTKDIMGILGICRSKAYDLMRTPGFPVIHDGRHNRYIVSRDAFFKWLNEDAFQRHSLKNRT